MFWGCPRWRRYSSLTHLSGRAHDHQLDAHRAHVHAEIKFVRHLTRPIAIVVVDLPGFHVSAPLNAMSD